MLKWFEKLKDEYDYLDKMSIGKKMLQTLLYLSFVYGSGTVIVLLTAYVVTTYF